MLTVQPVSFRNCPKPAFGNMGSRNAYRSEDLEEDRSFFENQKAEIEGLLDDEKLPKPMKKLLKVANIVTDGIIAGISVACATIAGGKWGKGAYNKIASSKIAKNVAEPLKDAAGKGAEYAEGYAKKGFNSLLDSKFGQKILNALKKIKSTKIGEKFANITNKVIEKTKNFFKGMNIFKTEEKFDKATQKTATVLGAGSGIASAYATAVKNSETEGEEE